MPKKFRPVTPSLRQLVLPTFEELTRVGSLRGDSTRATVAPHKPLLAPKRRTSGRNNNGHITCRHRGGAHKRAYRKIDFRRDKDGIPATVLSVEYDPNRSARIALVCYADGEKRYILAPKGIAPGMKVHSGEGSPIRVGCCMSLAHMPLGSVVHNLEMLPGKGGVLVRAAGLSAQLVARSEGMATVRMPSGEFRLIQSACRATLGEVSHSEHNLRVEGKAGRMRWKGVRPTVRGTAMNPVDHPHGGGEGRHRGNIPQTPWAQPTKGFRTRKKNKTNKWIVKDRRK